MLALADPSNDVLPVAAPLTEMVRAVANFMALPIEVAPLTILSSWSLSHLDLLANCLAWRLSMPSRPPNTGSDVSS